MEFNIEQAEQVLAQIELTPELHYQDHWVAESECGTVRCIAGWYVHLAATEAGSAEYGHHEYRRRYAAKHGLGDKTYRTVAAHLAGLSQCEAERIFYTSSESYAIELLKRSILAAKLRKEGTVEDDDTDAGETIVLDEELNDDSF